jgi:3-phenylpropionate/trans-cinnamate dioxygenase ferredoxin subunit
MKTAGTARQVFRVCALSALKDNDVTGFPVGMTSVCVARMGKEVFAMLDACSHEGVKLSEGWLDADRKVIECWRHASCFSLESGEPDGPPAHLPIPVYRAWVENDDVMVEV